MTSDTQTSRQTDTQTDKLATDTQTSWQKTHRQVGRRQSGTMTTMMMMIIDDDAGNDGLSKPRETCFWVQPEHSATIKAGHPQLALCVDRHAIRRRSGGDPTVCWKRNQSTLIRCNKTERANQVIAQLNLFLRIIKECTYSLMTLSAAFPAFSVH